MSKHSIYTLFYRNYYLLVLSIIILLIAGSASIKNLPRLEDPRITQRVSTIVTFFPGASAERIEIEINKVIEDSLEEISEIKKIESTAKSNVSTIFVELDDSITKANNQELFSKIRNRVKNIEADLPAESSTPYFDDSRIASGFSVLLALRLQEDTASSLNLLQRLSLELKEQLLQIPNTELAKIYGGIEEEILITPNLHKLSNLGISSASLANSIKAFDNRVKTGQLVNAQYSLNIELNGKLNSIEEIKSIPILSQSGKQISVGDIATVAKSYKTPRQQVALYQNQESIFIAARADDTIRLDQWTQQAKQVIANFKNNHQHSIHIDSLFEQNRYTEKRLKDLVINLLVGALLVVFIVFFTMGLRAGIVVALSLPLAASGALFSFSFFDQGIHQMSIFGLIIAIGLLIDSAIVMTDEVRKQIQIGVKPLLAMENAVKHLLTPLLASTLTTVLGFMPVFLLPGNAGDFIGPIAISVVMALIFSFFVSITIIPAIAAKVTAVIQKGQQPWWRTGVNLPNTSNNFKSVLHRMMQKPLLFITLLCIPSFCGFYITTQMEVEFFPAADRDMFEIKMWGNTNNSLEKTIQLTTEANRLLEQNPNIKNSYWLTGSSIPPVYYNQFPVEDNSSYFSQGVMLIDSPKQAEQAVIEAHNLLNQKIPEATFVVSKFAQGPPIMAPVMFKIMGPKLETLKQLGQEVRSVIHEFPEVTNTRATLTGGEAKILLIPNDEMALNHQLNQQSISQQIQANLEGINAGALYEDTEKLPIRVKAPEFYKDDMEGFAMQAISIPNSNNWIPLNVISDYRIEPEISKITRESSQRVNTIYGYLSPDAKAISVTNRMLEKINQEIDLPDGYSIQLGGDSKEQNEAIRNLLMYLPIILTIMAATLILLFNSVFLALIIASVGMLSVGLGFLSLFAAGFPIGFNPLIGCVGLTGVAINDTIVILAAIRSNTLAKQGDINAIIDETFGCGRHVLSTTFTTIAGFIPLLYLTGGFFWPPLAIVIAGGIGLSLMLAMFYTPLAYKLYVSMTGFFKKGLSKRLTNKNL